MQAAKDRTSAILSSGHGQGTGPETGPEGSLDELLADAEPPKYIAIQAFIDPAREGELDGLVLRARETGCVVTKGLGPRYLHSTGQLHKGGPNTILAVQVVDDFGEELEIPGRDFGFRQLIAAQAAGDLEALKERGRQCLPRAPGRPEMKLGMVGLGRMGSGMTERLRRDGHEVMTYDPKVESTASSLEELATQLEPPRAVWLMIPSGEPTEAVFHELLGILEVRATRSSTAATRTSMTRKRRSAEAAERGDRLRRRRRLGRDLGADGGLLPDGRRRPTSPSSGSSRSSSSLAPEDGWAHVGPSGAGHFAKMVHNGIEYGLMQSYGEGFEIMHASEYDLDLRADLRHLALRVGRPLLAARAPARRVRRSTEAGSTTSPATSRTPARVAGRSMRRSTRTCPHR